MFSIDWELKELKNHNAPKVLSTFSCGGGSSMGYKRAGFDVIANVEIDERIAATYNENLKPKYNYVKDIRDFNEMIKKGEVPEELYGLDILDGSPPCSTFSHAGEREKGWGIEKKFREGQKKQRLDDLFFHFLKTVELLRPRVFVAENVTGLIHGNAKGYVKEILYKAKNMGYKVQIFKLNSARMNVPQKRERIFFIGQRESDYKDLKLEFKESPILFGKVRTAKGAEQVCNYQYLIKYLKNERNLADLRVKAGMKYSHFNFSINHDTEVARTIISGSSPLRACDLYQFSIEDLRRCGTFPIDYKFPPSYSQTKFLIGMSVPPNMMANIAQTIKRQIFL